MPRMTRAKAAEAVEHLHIDADAMLEVVDENVGSDAKTPFSGTHNDRPPLGEIAANSSDGKAAASSSDDASQEMRKSTRGRKGGRKVAAKNKKINLAASRAGIPAVEPEVLPDESDSPPSPASEEAADELLTTMAEGVRLHAVVRDTSSQSPPSPAVRLTRRQLAKTAKVDFELEPKSLIDGIGQTPDEQREAAQENNVMKGYPIILADDDANDHSQCGEQTMAQTGLDAPPSPLPSAMPNVVMNLRKDTPAKRSTSNKENIEPVDTPTSEAMQSPAVEPTVYDELEEAVVHSTTPPHSAVRSPSRPEDHIVALDQLDDALENVTKDIPEVPTSPEKNSHVKKEAVKDGKKDTKKSPPVVKATKASQARLSMIQGAAKPPAWGKPRPSTTLARSNSARQPSTQPEPGSKRVPSGSSSIKDGKTSTTEAEKKAVVIPHSKPRPVSLSFPTPPPPPKSTKAPTQSSFKLPGDAIAEKLKAQREARMAKLTEEDGKKKTFKARPVPASLRAAPSVRPTNASRARESIMGARDLKGPAVATMPAIHKRANSVVATSTTSSARPRVASKEAPKPGSLTAKPGVLVARQRPSTAMANLSKPAAPSSTTSTTRSTTTGPARGTAKGKEVFNRVAAAKHAAEREKRDKEDAAKKARASAAERGRLASREWAEKQKSKKMGVGKPDTAAVAPEEAKAGDAVELGDQTAETISEQVAGAEANPVTAS